MLLERERKKGRRGGELRYILKKKNIRCGFFVSFLNDVDWWFLVCFTVTQ